MSTKRQTYGFKDIELLDEEMTIPATQSITFEDIRRDLGLVTVHDEMW